MMLKFAAHRAGLNNGVKLKRHNLKLTGSLLSRWMACYVLYCTIEITLEDKKMGFSLESLFKQLEQVINNKDIDEQDQLAELIEKIEWWKSYAIRCGNIENT